MDESFIAAPPEPAVFARAKGPELESLYEELFARIEHSEPALRCFATGSPDRQRIMGRVRELVREHPDPANRPPLFGAPVGVKDIFRVRDRAPGCGSLLPPDLFQGPQAACVSALEAAGAVVMGLTATAEFAYFEPAATRNPHDTGRTPGGSSSGSAAGVAAGYFPLALGTQTVGSIIRPAAFCGVVGFKPTRGRIPADGLVFFSRSVDQVGFFCREPAVCDTIMSAAFPEWEHKPEPKRLRLGLPVGPYLDQAEKLAVARLRERLAELAAKAAGPGTVLEVLRTPCLEDVAEIAARHEDLISAEVGREHENAGWFPRFGPLYRPRTARIIRDGLRVGRTRIEEARRSMDELRGRLHALMDDKGLDAFVCPGAPGEAPQGIGSTGSPAMSLPWTHAGMPAINLPAGTGPGGAPLGLQLVGRASEDERLISAARLLHGLATR